MQPIAAENNFLEEDVVGPRTKREVIMKADAGGQTSHSYWLVGDMGDRIAGIVNADEQQISRNCAR